MCNLRLVFMFVNTISQKIRIRWIRAGYSQVYRVLQTISG